MGLLNRSSLDVDELVEHVFAGRELFEGKHKHMRQAVVTVLVILLKLQLL